MPESREDPSSPDKTHGPVLYGKACTCHCLLLVRAGGRAGDDALCLLSNDLGSRSVLCPFVVAHFLLIM